MIQEEKAKAYDDAIKRAKRMFSEKELNYLFPELAESDDEKIISAIRKAIKAKVENLGNGITRTACLAWLEKQEDKDSQVKLPTFTFDDILALQCCMETVKKVQEDKDLYEKLNDIHGRVYDAYHLEKQGKQKEINLVNILKHYPRETELYSPMYGKLWLAEVDEKHEIITCYKHCLAEGCTRAILEQEDTVSFYYNGTTGLPDFNISKDCMLFLYDIKTR